MWMQSEPRRPRDNTFVYRRPRGEEGAKDRDSFMGRTGRTCMSTLSLLPAPFPFFFLYHTALTFPAGWAGKPNSWKWPRPWRRPPLPSCYQGRRVGGRGDEAHPDGGNDLPGKVANGGGDPPIPSRAVSSSTTKPCSRMVRSQSLKSSFAVKDFFAVFTGLLQKPLDFVVREIRHESRAEHAPIGRAAGVRCSTES